MPRLTRARIPGARASRMRGAAGSTGARSGGSWRAAASIPRPGDTGMNGARLRGGSCRRIRCASSAGRPEGSGHPRSPITSCRTKGTWSCSGTGANGRHCAGAATAAKLRRMTAGGGRDDAYILSHGTTGACACKCPRTLDIDRACSAFFMVSKLTRGG